MLPLRRSQIMVSIMVLLLQVGAQRLEPENPTGFEGSFSTNQEILVPNIDLTKQKWFDPNKAMEDLRLSQVRLSASLRPSLNPANSEYDEVERRVDADNENLRADIQRVHRLSDEIRMENKKLQKLPIFREAISPDDSQGYSLVQIGDQNNTIEDWNYCACGTGPNGTLVYPDRAWPDLPLTSNTSTPSSSMLQIHLNGRRLALRQQSECTCTNPWESFDNSSNMCKLINTVTVCLVHVSSDPSPPEIIASQAQNLLKAIDSAVSTPSFMEIWTPFRFQL